MRWDRRLQAAKTEDPLRPLSRMGILGQQLQTTWDGPVKKEGPEITELGRLSILRTLLDGLLPTVRVTRGHLTFAPIFGAIS